MSRPSWNEYFMEMAELTARRSSCLRRQVGAVIVVDRRVVATGYNGAPAGCDTCLMLGYCMRDKLGIPSGERHELCRAVHAEQNAIAQAAKFGQRIEGATMYVTNQPCILCAKLLINAGIDMVYYQGDYPDQNTAAFLKEADVALARMEKNP